MPRTEVAELPEVEDPEEESGWSKRKHVPQKGEDHDTLDSCLCRIVLNGSEDEVLKCKQAGCETQWFHLKCVELGQAPWNWVCVACAVSGRGHRGKRSC
ncbi:uncharacterized protein LACBIDRAFT_315326 [Laccaria bicolor S238N-H82]|uniref:Predicted protein n=1 Tax=Laccaria bicolor (strain S238N-H82 / ATCC MYA-4686) TaxID=486041 RepID=B0D251_LACBS|nr:uncharacterized protein LACBIDRAFT_315326 [Laccaria bicolor S238N-H82]EDR10685.1 predicted protein [Laccaria bicolor S238N-H82]|eukprot:XP_001877986.1 predicted protein [Laccaria bicolor S238N-H82]